MVPQAPRHPDLASTVHAVEANLFAFFQHLSKWPRVEVHDDGDCVWTISDLPFPLFNSVMGARLGDDRLDRLIEARMQACRERRVPMLWWTGPSTAPAHLGQCLENRGFVIEPAFGMAADLSHSPPGTEFDTNGKPVSHSPPGTEFDTNRRPVSHFPPGTEFDTNGKPVSHSPPGTEFDSIAIERVRDRERLAVWSRVLCDGFGAPQTFGRAFAEMAEAIGLHHDAPFRHYLARVNGEPVATSSLFLGADVAGLYDVSTLPERRRRGIGAAVTRYAMADARAEGCRTAILHASPLGVGMYRSLGFDVICDIGQHVWVPDHFNR